MLICRSGRWHCRIGNIRIDRLFLLQFFFVHVLMHKECFLLFSPVVLQLNLLITICTQYVSFFMKLFIIVITFLVSFLAFIVYNMYSFTFFYIRFTVYFAYADKSILCLVGNCLRLEQKKIVWSNITARKYESWSCSASKLGSFKNLIGKVVKSLFSITGLTLKYLRISSKIFYTFFNLIVTSLGSSLEGVELLFC